MKKIFEWKIPEGLGELSGMNIYLAVTDTGGLRIGTNLMWVRKQMHSFYFGSDVWSNLVYLSDISFELEYIMVHWLVKDDGIYCNIGKDLSIDDNEFPFFFASNIRRKAIEKQQKDQQEAFYAQFDQRAQ
jgi:hypothetical protein